MEKISYHASVKEAITQALLILMKHEPYEEISVAEIVRKAGVGRSSFYRAFLDKNDVLEQYVTSLFSLSSQLDDPYSSANLKQTIILHYKAYYENREFLKTLVRNRILYRFMGTMRMITEDTIERNNLTINVYQPAFFSAACLGVLTRWLERDCKETPEEVADILITLLFHTPGRDL